MADGTNYQAVVVVAFGGPEKMEEVIPFLEYVLRGRPVPRERLLAVAEHYYHFGGKSPINCQARELVAALAVECPLPVYWGARNSHPFLAGTLRQMATDGVTHALAIATSAYPSYSGCRQYLEDIERARAEVGPTAPIVHKLAPFSSNPLFVAATADRLRDAIERAPHARLVYTAHSIPLAMAATSCYEEQLRAVATAAGIAAGRTEWDLAWQSRSGAPGQPWLEPDILDHLRALASSGVKDVIVAPIGFLSDHMEVLYDLDVEAAALARELGMNMLRAATVGTHPLLIRLLNESIAACLANGAPPPCPADCCPPPAVRPRPGTTAHGDSQGR